MIQVLISRVRQMSALTAEVKSRTQDETTRTLLESIGHNLQRTHDDLETLHDLLTRQLNWKTRPVPHDAHLGAIEREPVHER